MALSNKSFEEINFWKENIHKNNGYPFKANPLTSKILFTDASDKGYGGFVCYRLSKVLCRGSFTRDEIQTSSTCRELLAVKYALNSFSDISSGESVQVNVDNYAAS